MKNNILAISAFILFLSGSVNASAILVDEFTIIKNGSMIYQDTFDDGLAPPDASTISQTYKVFGGPVIETGGRVALDASSGEAVVRPDAGNMTRQGVRVKTNINPAEPGKGLRTDDTFSITGLFDLTAVSGIRERYGVRLTDGGQIDSDDSVGLSVMRTSASQIDVVFHSYDQTAFAFTDLEAFALDDSHDQISLTLSRLNSATNDITASFAYVDGGVSGSTITFTTTDTIFNGAEDWTRAQVMHVAPVPVPAATWLFASGLLGLIGIVRQKSIS